MPLIKNEFDTAEPMEIYKNMRQAYIEEGYEEFSNIQDGISSNISAIIFGLPFAVIFIPLYKLITKTYPNPSLGVFVLSFVLLFLSTPVHEALHGIGWSLFKKSNFKNIYMYLPFGLADAYCHCSAPMGFKRYSIGTMLPFALLSVLIFIISCFISSPVMLYFSLFNSFGCGSDIFNTIIAYKHRDEIILDYPTDCGFTSYKK